jgi:hypothetical protein
MWNKGTNFATKAQNVIQKVLDSGALDIVGQLIPKDVQAKTRIQATRIIRNIEEKTYTAMNYHLIRHILTRLAKLENEPKSRDIEIQQM